MRYEVQSLIGKSLIWRDRQTDRETVKPKRIWKEERTLKMLKYEIKKTMDEEKLEMGRQTDREKQEKWKRDEGISVEKVMRFKKYMN